MTDKQNDISGVPAARVPACKRLFDVALSLLGLIVGAPIIGLIALAIRLDTPGNVLFSQERLGAGGRVFRLLKFRKFPATWGTGGPGVTVAGDVRMTRVGRFLERTKLDELPQLWNILKGEMSFVGPRPESLRYADLFTGRFAEVLRYRPGIFGPNQIDYRNESEMYPADEDPEDYYRRVLFPAKAEQDLAYFSRANCFSDVAWIVKGVLVSVVGTVNWGCMFRHHVPVLLFDVVAIVTGWSLAVAMRYGFWDAIGSQFPLLTTGWFVFPAVVIPAMIIGGCYAHTLRHVVLADVVRHAVVVSIAWGIAFLLLMYSGSRNISIMLVPLGLLLVLVFMIAPRILYKEHYRRLDVNRKDKNAKARVLIYGTDDRAINLGSLIQRGFPSAHLVGFVDDTGEVRGRSILDLKILGSERDLPTIHAVHHFNQLWFAQVPDGIKLSRIRLWATEVGVEIVVLPAIKAFSLLCGEFDGEGGKRDSRPVAGAAARSTAERGMVSG